VGAVLTRAAGDGATRMVDLLTGATRWRAARADCQYDLDRAEDPSVWVQLCPSGALTTTDLATGQVTRQATVDLTPAGPYRGPAYPEGGMRLTVAYGTAVVTIFDAVSLDWSISGYDLSDLRLRWGHRPIDADQYLIPCPPDRLCTVSDQVSQVISLDTGDMIGTTVPVWDQPLHRVDLTGHQADEPPAVVLAPDGAPLDTRSHDSVVFVSHAGDFLTAPRFTSANATWVFDARPDPTAPDGYRYQPVGRIPGVYATRCVAYARTASDRLLACATALNTLTVWSVPPGPA
jgi:hypothetical protein